jgi:hypothetical protein
VEAAAILQQANRGLVSLRHYVESHNGRIADEVNHFYSLINSSFFVLKLKTLQLDSNMVHWLIQILINLAPNQPKLSREAYNHLEATREPIENLVKTQKTLCHQLDSITKYIVK